MTSLNHDNDNNKQVNSNMTFAVIMSTIKHVVKISFVNIKIYSLTEHSREK